MAREPRSLSRRELLRLAWLKREDEVPVSADKAAPSYQGLRPPGAVEPDLFAELCNSCGACIEACPVEAIYARDDGTPTLDPLKMPCVLCLDVPCSRVCPTGALMPLWHPREIRMGVARIDESGCFAFAGQSCTLCFEVCPFPHQALRLWGDPPVPNVSLSLCTGCGICAYRCPAKAITVTAEVFA